MSILNELVEKKDIECYIIFRIKVLEGEKKVMPSHLEPRDRERTIKVLEGRIRELETLRKHIHKIKEMSKDYWEKAAMQTNQD